jgi:hypothetical protein
MGEIVYIYAHIRLGIGSIFLPNGLGILIYLSLLGTSEWDAGPHSWASCGVST